MKNTIIFLLFIFSSCDLTAQIMYQNQYAFHHDSGDFTKINKYLYLSDNSFLYGGTNYINLLSLPDSEETIAITFGVQSSMNIIQLLSDDEGNIYVYGLYYEGPNLATAGTYTTELLSSQYNTNTYFIAKYDENYNQQWFTYLYYGGHNIAIDHNQNVYFLSKQSKFTPIPNAPFQTNVEILTGDTNELKTIFGKLNSNGELVWKSFLSYHNTTLTNIVTSDTQVAIVGEVNKTGNNPITDPTFFSTEGAIIENAFIQENDNNKIFLNSFDFDGNRIWGTYLSTNTMWSNFNTTFITHENNIYLNYPSTDINTTLNPFYALNTNPFRLTKFDQNGNNVWTHYGNERIKSLAADEIGNLWIGGHHNELMGSNSLTIIPNEHSYQSAFMGNHDAVHIKLSNDGENVIYNTYYGDRGLDENKKIFPTINGYISLEYTRLNDNNTAFLTHGPPLNYNMYENNYQGLIITRFYDSSLANTDNSLHNIKLYPNPANEYITIENTEVFSSSDSIEILNSLGQTIVVSKFESDYNKTLDCSNWAQGIYFLKIHSSGKTGTYKIIKQ